MENRKYVYCIEEVPYALDTIFIGAFYLGLDDYLRCILITVLQYFF